MGTYSNKGSRYVVTFVDKKSRLVRVYYLRKKSEVPEKTKIFLAWVRNQRGEYPKNLNSDGGGEYVNKELASFCEQLGIDMEQTSAYSPEQNGIAERINRTLCEGTYAMLRHANLPLLFWEEAMSNFVFIKNRTPHTKLKGQRPIDLWNDDLGEVEREDLWNMQQFGCRADVHIPPSKRKGGKDGPKVKVCIYLGKAPGKKADMFWDFTDDKIIYGHSNYFYPKIFPLNPQVNIPSSSSRKGILKAPTPKPEKKVQFSPTCTKPGSSVSETHGSYHSDSSLPDLASDSEIDNDSDSEPTTLSDTEDTDNHSQDEDTDNHSQDDHSPSDSDSTNSEISDVELHSTDDDDLSVSNDEEVIPEPRYSQRIRNTTSYAEPNLKTRLRNVQGESRNVGYTAHETQALLTKAATGKSKPPKLTRNKMLQRPDKDNFIADEIHEIDSGFTTGCFEKVDKGDVPDGTPIYNLMWVYKVKPETELEAQRYRSRLCVLGNRQKSDSYGNTFAAVAKVKMFRLLLTLCVHFGMKMTQLDVSNAFMYADLDRDIYVYPPPGYKHLGLLKLNKSLYGLKQAPRLWYDTMKTELECCGFKQLYSDVCCFTHPTKRCYVLMYVDDICIVTNDEILRNELIHQLKQKFKLKHFKQAKRYVGLQLAWSKAGQCVKVFQADYITKVLEIFGMSNCKSSPSPAEGSVKLSKHDPVTKERPYRQLVGSLLYVLGSRPDVASPIRVCSQFVAQAADLHWRAAKQILRYLAGTRDKGVVYTHNPKYTLEAYCDSDFASEEDRKSITGYVVYAQGGPVVWKSKKQAVIALSSCEAEYVALSEVTKELLWMSMALKELKVQPDKHRPMRIYMDNQAAKRLAENAVNHERSKHIDIKYHHLRECVASGKVQLYYVDTKENVSDLLTKSTSRKVFAHLVDRLIQ